MVEALEHIHDAGYAHRDIKLNNILLGEDLNIKVVDLGFAGLLSGVDGLMRTKLGTEPYKAPEIHEGKLYSGEKVDIFSLGVTIFCTIAGNLPFLKADQKDIFYDAIKRKDWEVYWKALTRN